MRLAQLAQKIRELGFSVDVVENKYKKFMLVYLREKFLCIVEEREGQLYAFFYTVNTFMADDLGKIAELVKLLISEGVKLDQTERYIKVLIDVSELASCL